MVYTLEQFVSDGKKNNYTPEQMDIINKERIKKRGVGVAGRNEIYSGFKQQKPQTNAGLGKIGSTALGLGIVGGAGALIEGFGRGMYKMGLPKVQSEVDMGLQSKQVTEPMYKTASEKNIMGTAKMQGKQAYRLKTAIFEENITPALKRLDNAGLRLNYGSLKNDAIDKINSDKSMTIAQKKDHIEEINDYFDDVVKKEGKRTTYTNANNMKKSLTTRTSKKVQEGKLSPKVQQNVDKVIADVTREQIHNGLQSDVGGLKNSKELMAKYNNYNAIYEKSRKSGMADFGGGVLSVESGVVKKTTPTLFTVGGRVIQTVGKAMKEATGVGTVIRGIKIGAKEAKKAIKYIAKSPIGKLAKGLMMVDPTGVLGTIIDTEINTKGLKGNQIKTYSQVRLTGKSSEEAAKIARESDPNKFTLYY